ncbi:S41 family peptidase [Chloroflexota bacterium]
MFKRIGIIAIILMLVGLTLSWGACYAPRPEVPTSPSQSLDAIEQVWVIIFKSHVDKDILDASALSEAAITGMVEALDDPYAAYLDAESYRLGINTLQGKFYGIGAYVSLEDEQIIIVAPLPGSSAESAGIRAGDVVLEVDGISVAGMSLSETIFRVRGPEGTSVSLLVQHQDGGEPEEISIVRAEVEVPSIRFEMREDIAYIKIGFFTNRTAEELSPALESLKGEGASGIILDLRSSPGGIVEAVVSVASRFLSEGTVIHVVDNEGGRTSIGVNPGAVVTDLPVVALVDGYSASGAEVLAGALQDYGRATIAGTKTFGKGSVNTLYPLGDGSGLYITTARWLTPNERPIEGVGISPDIELELEGEDAIGWAMDYLRK